MSEKYIGVYKNNTEKYGGKAYRVAIKTYKDGKAHYQNYDSFDHEGTAAWVYNVHALCTFGPNAVINNLEIEPHEEREFDTYVVLNDEFYKLFLKAEKIINNTRQLRFHVSERLDQDSKEPTDQ